MIYIYLITLPGKHTYLYPWLIDWLIETYAIEFFLIKQCRCMYTWNHNKFWLHEFNLQTIVKVLDMDNLLYEWLSYKQWDTKCLIFNIIDLLHYYITILHYTRNNTSSFQYILCSITCESFLYLFFIFYYSLLIVSVS